MTSPPDDQDVAILQHRESMKRAFSHMNKDIKMARVSVQGGHVMSMNLDLIMLFSPMMRSIMESLPTHPAWVDVEPVLVIPDVHVDTLIKIKQFLMYGKADSFQSSGEGRCVVEASDIMDLGIRELHKDGIKIIASGSGSMRSRRNSSSDGVPIISSASTIKKEKTLDLGMGMEEEQHVPDPAHGGDNEGSLEAPLMLTFDATTKAEPVAALNHTTENAQPMTKPIKPSKDNGFTCALCPQGKRIYKVVNQLYSHYIGSHFQKEIAEHIDNGVCRDCGKSFDIRGKVELHVGISHRKIHAILKINDITVEDSHQLARVATLPIANSNNSDSSNTLTNEDIMPTNSATVPALALSSPTSSVSPNKPPCHKKKETQDRMSSPVVTTPTSSRKSGRKVTPTVKAKENSLALVPVTPVTPVTLVNNNDAVASVRKRKLSGNSCNYDQRCEVCGHEFKTSTLFEQHMVKHFLKDVEEVVTVYMNLSDEMSCKICGDIFKQKDRLVMHLGGKHGYINEVLMMKGMSVLPCTVNSTGYSAAKQKMLCRIKKERREEEEAGGAHEDIRKQLELEMESPSNANNGATEEILEKYKNII